MSAIIAPPAAFGQLYQSTTPESLEKILLELDLASLEQELFRLERAVQALSKSNTEINAFIEEEAQTVGGSPDPEFVLAIKENEEVIRKYEATCVALKRVIQQKRNSEGGIETDASVGSLGSVEHATSTTPHDTHAPPSVTDVQSSVSTPPTTTEDDGVYL
ncbi:hypothetical protein BGZ94_008362 [Podila epigama]|nr:hypothetical protein BGZ94_008362 [Podila epigama]